MHANHREEVEELHAGELGAVIGLKDTTTGDTLCDEDHPILLETMEFPEPVIHVAIEPKTKAGQEKMGIALSKTCWRRSYIQNLYRSRNWSNNNCWYGWASLRNHCW